jgi:hypothetical protein
MSSFALLASWRLKKLIGFRPTFRGVPPVAVRGSVLTARFAQDAKSAKKKFHKIELTASPSNRNPLLVILI